MFSEITQGRARAPESNWMLSEITRGRPPLDHKRPPLDQRLCSGMPRNDVSKRHGATAAIVVTAATVATASIHSILTSLLHRSTEEHITMPTDYCNSALCLATFGAQDDSILAFPPDSMSAPSVLKRDPHSRHRTSAGCVIQRHLARSRQTVGLELILRELILRGLIVRPVV